MPGRCSSIPKATRATSAFCEVSITNASKTLATRICWTLALAASARCNATRPVSSSRWRSAVLALPTSTFAALLCKLGNTRRSATTPGPSLSCRLSYKRWNNCRRSFQASSARFWSDNPAAPGKPWAWCSTVMSSTDSPLRKRRTRLRMRWSSLIRVTLSCSSGDGACAYTCKARRLSLPRPWMLRTRSICSASSSPKAPPRRRNMR
ncbi:hypothetical protein D3C79_717350 [compost metagenome]